MRARAAALAGLLGLFGAGVARAEGPPMQVESAFVEHHLVLQSSDRDDARQALVLSVAANVLAALGPDKVAIDVVAFGPGIDLLSRDNPRRVLVDSLVAQGVRFDACGNTMTTIERDTGQKFPLNPRAHTVEAGVVRIMELVEHGYILVRP